MVLRAAACFLIGLVVFYAIENQNYDFRFRMRGPQPISEDVVIFTISEAEVLNFYGNRFNLIRPIQEATSFSDSFYWDRELWAKTLKLILSAEPKAIGVSFFFGESLSEQQYSREEQAIFYHPKVVWGSTQTSDSRVLFSRFTNPFGDNTGLLDTPLGVDKVARYFSPQGSRTRHFTSVLLSVAQENIANFTPALDNELKVINYRGVRDSWTRYTLADLIHNEEQVLPNLKGKIVLIGTTNSQSHIVFTPVGPLSRVELMANLVENLRDDLWIRQFPNLVSILYLACVCIFGVVVVLYYPQIVALLIFFWIGTAVFMVSAYFFDNNSVWIPIQSPLLVLVAVWIVFVSYNGMLAEQRTWKLTREQDLLFEMEELKNNFVSLISHDLKTPIAKIQALVDQLLGQFSGSPETVATLNTIRGCSQELDRYIRSIINLSRVEARNIKLQITPFDLNQLIKEVCQRFAPLIQQKHMEVHLELEPLFSIEADKRLISEVVSNLLENAIKYGKPESRIAIETHEVDGRVNCKISNLGDPIPFAEQKTIWNKFVRGQEQAQKTQGTGLGLYLVRYFIELHKGQVSLTSEENGKTQVSFSLPVELDTEVG